MGDNCTVGHGGRTAVRYYKKDRRRSQSRVGNVGAHCMRPSGAQQVPQR